MNLPNGLTLIRIFLVPFIVVVLLTRPTEIQSWAIWGVSLFLGAALTDLLDGYFARRRKQVTTLGRLLDPIADKLLISSALISLVELDLAEAWMVAIIVGREFAVNGLRSIASSEGFAIEASTLGKGKMVLQVAAVVGLILGRAHPGWISQTAKFLLWAVVASALVSMVQYFKEFWSKLDTSIKHREYRRLRLLARQRQIRAERRELRRLRRLEGKKRSGLDAEPRAMGSLQDSG
ncbi:MAG: CDP-diacylglycerol--glycerol-3-phosphate 3-phosphatidyltransferase [Acidobacteria bacterium]|jgi:CDP-diacylglycerol--glycerol-3-phosphate 3-phosphatidyltransferase|nr:CDP-diacylglycerol--glycerol-3-phosphate 3-phosphatidyltransferase [Acidobacteriota bacterium]